MALRWVVQLLESGLVTDAQVRASHAGDADLRAVDTVRNLIAQGLDERTLAGFFVSLGYGPILQARELARVDPDLVRSLAGRVAHDLCALPLRPSPAGAIVAMADPTDQDAVDALSDALGGSILPTVARFSDLLAALDEIYPGDRPTIVSDALSVERSRHPSGVVPLVQERPTMQKNVPSSAEPTRSSIEPKLADLTGTASAVWDRAWGQSTGVGSLAPPASPPPSAPAKAEAPVSVEPNLSEFDRAATRDDVVRVACEACLAVASGAAFLALRKGVFRGLDGAGANITSAGIRSLWVPATNPSVLNDVVHSGKPFHGPHGQTAADHLVRAALGSQGRDIMVAPVRIGDRMLGLLCATDAGSDIDAVEAIASAMGQAFERVIVLKKA
ncbi:MAG: hypothetical protein WBG86_22210 [Polyangiales bacterium]